MLNQLLKFTLVSSLLLWLKPRWKGLLALCVSVILVHVIHGEYLGYVELSDDRSFLVWSYVLKWLALLAAVVVYLISILSGPRKAGTRAGNGRIARAPDEQVTGPDDDGFDFLRHKAELKNRADMLISRQAGGEGDR